MVTKSKIYLLWFRFWCLAPILPRGLTWVKLCAWTQNHPKNVGTCPGLPLQLISQNQSSKIIGLNPLPPPLTKLTTFVGKCINPLIFNPIYVDLIQIEVCLFRTDHLHYDLIKLHFKMLTL